MELNQYHFYSINSDSNKSEKELELILEKLKDLKTFKKEEEVRTFLKDNYGINDDIENFNICSNIVVSTGVGKKYYNVTLEYTHDEEVDIKSYNYTKKERGLTW